MIHSWTNTRWISAFMPEEIEELTNNNFGNYNQIYDYVDNLQTSIHSVDQYYKFLIQYQRQFLTNIICSHTD